MSDLNQNEHLEIGAVLFPGMDQADFTGPFEVLSQLPNSGFHVVAKEKTPLRDARGLILTPEKTFAEAPQLDLLIVPGGGGVNGVMEDEAVLGFIRQQALKARMVMSVCTGALVCGAAGLLKGRKATTHWASHHFLERFGAISVHSRVVVDGKMMSTAGVTAGYDGSLQMAALLRGEQVAQRIQLYPEYAPEPPFNSGSPETARAELVQAGWEALRKLLEERAKVVERAAKRLGSRVYC
jgi:cyclohexyl-isocyanide hydratase